MSKHLVLMFTSEFAKLSTGLQQEVYGEFYRLVYPFVFFLLKDHGVTEDIIQESFIRVIQKSHQLQEINKLESWIKTVTRNVAYNYLSTLNRNRNELDTEGVLHSRDEIASSSDLPDVEVELRMMKESISDYLNQISPDYRKVIEMRSIENLSYKEIAAILNVSEAIVRQKLFRAREAVKKKFQAEWRLSDEKKEKG